MTLGVASGDRRDAAYLRQAKGLDGGDHPGSRFRTHSRFISHVHGLTLASEGNKIGSVVISNEPPFRSVRWGPER